MSYRNQKRGLPTGRQGYIAIIASIVIATIVGVVSLVFSSSNFLGRYDTLALEEKGIAHALAEGCVEYTKIKIVENPSYGGNETVGLASSSCRVVAVTPEGPNLRITTTATIGNHTTNLSVVLRGSDFSVVSREEKVSF